MVISALDLKLLRDLKRIKVQASAIALVIALGVMMLVMMDGLVNTLEETRKAYYERYRLADIFVPVMRAPRNTIKKLTKINGISAIEGRIIGSALINLPFVDTPLQAKTVSLPDFVKPTINQYKLTKGRHLNPQQNQEILVLDSFATVRNLSLNSKLKLTINGAQRDFTIVGFAQSPEFLYTTAPGELVPDDGRFAVIWMSETALESAFDMKGAYNELIISTDLNSDNKQIIVQLDRELKPYGALGAYSLDDQLSNRFVTEEISGLKASSLSVPPIFLGVAAFLLYIVVSRIIQSERQQIGLLKAFGYKDLEISTHYLKLVLIIAICGALLGSVFGVLAGSSLASVYQQYFKFPFIVFLLNFDAFFIGIIISIIAASLGGLFALKTVFVLTPAVAMRSPTPIDYGGSGSSKIFKTIFDQPTRMILRRVRRQFKRMLGAIIGVATGLALSAGMMSILSGFDQTINLTFTVIDRSDANVVFIHPLSSKAILELEQIPGILSVEPYRATSVVFHNNRLEYRGSIEGLTESPELYRALNSEYAPINLPHNGIVLSALLAKKLQITVGELLHVEVKEGRQPNLSIPVTAIAETLLGSPTYMSLVSLNKLLKEPDRVSGAYLTLDKKFAADVYKKIKQMPKVAGITLKQDTMLAFEKTMNEGAGAMRYVMALIAGIITFGIVYNAARIAHAEQEKELASLRVIGFTKTETAYVLLGELAFIILASLPLGAILGFAFSHLIAQGFSTDLYQIPALFNLNSFAIATSAVIISGIISGWLVKRDIDNLDLVSALKSKE